MANYNERQLNNGEQGEGSGLNADKVDNSEASELGETIDDLTITKNSQEELRQSETLSIIGDFENSFGDWTKSASGDWTTSDIIRTDSVSYKGNYSVKFDAAVNSKTGTFTISRSVDFSDFSESELSNFFMWANVGVSLNDQIFLKVIVNGNEELSVSNQDLTQNSWVQITLDLSNYSGTNDVTIEWDIQDDQSSWGLYVDYIGFKATDMTIQNILNGSGN